MCAEGVKAARTELLAKFAAVERDLRLVAGRLDASAEAAAARASRLDQPLTRLAFRCTPITPFSRCINSDGDRASAK